MVRIAHLADIHVRGLSRLDEYTEVFTAFMNQVRDLGVDHIFIGGDCFHTKTTGITPEYIDWMSWWLNSLASVAEVHLTLGNHDGNLTNKSRQDAVSPIVAALNNPKIHLYKKSGVYQFTKGYNWCVFSLFDVEGWTSVKPVPGDVNIACYHGPVWGAMTESDWELKEGLKVDDFKNYEFCLLGDIHKMQYLDFRECEIVIDEKDLASYPDAEVIEEL